MNTHAFEMYLCLEAKAIFFSLCSFQIATHILSATEAKSGINLTV